MTNELTTNQNIDTNTGEIITMGSTLEIINQNDEYVTYFNHDTNKYIRKAKYAEYSSVVAETREDKMWLLKLIENDGETGNGLSDHVGEEIVVQDIITRKYDKIDEDTGETIYGVLTYLITPDRIAYVTSSKSVYFTQKRIRELLGDPHEESWENVIVKVGSEKLENGTGVLIKLVG